MLVISISAIDFAKFSCTLCAGTFRSQKAQQAWHHGDLVLNKLQSTVGTGEIHSSL